jgi:hypothetical protein
MVETVIYPLGRSNPLRSQYIEIFLQDAVAFISIQRQHANLT